MSYIIKPFIDKDIKYNCCKSDSLIFRNSLFIEIIYIEYNIGWYIQSYDVDSKYVFYYGFEKYKNILNVLEKYEIYN